MVERDLDHLGDFVWRRPEVGPSFGFGDDGINAVIAWRDVERRQLAEDPHLGRRNTELLRGFAQGGLDWAFMFLHLSAGKGDLGLVVGQLRCSPGQDEIEVTFSRIDEDEHASAKAGLSGFLVGLVAGPRVGDHLELGFKSGLRPVEPLLEEPEV